MLQPNHVHFRRFRLDSGSRSTLIAALRPAWITCRAHFLLQFDASSERWVIQPESAFNTNASRPPYDLMKPFGGLSPEDAWLAPQPGGAVFWGKWALWSAFSHRCSCICLCTGVCAPQGVESVVQASRLTAAVCVFFRQVSDTTQAACAAWVSLERCSSCRRSNFGVPPGTCSTRLVGVRSALLLGVRTNVRVWVLLKSLGERTAQND
jgi:hypothetical protein